jgi:transcriptional regulator with XRE-family HTH domain
VRQRRLVAELRRLRDASGLKIDDVAQEIGISKSAISRLENGLTAIRLPVLRALLAAYSVDPAKARDLEQLCREANQRGWWQVAGPTNDYKTLVGLEAEATWVHYFGSSYIIGLLQTEDYARALLSAVLTDPTPEAVDLAVNIRLRRQERLNDLELWMVLGEEALMRPVGDHKIMARQIDRLIEASLVRGIKIQVMGLERGAHIGMAGGFEIIGLESARPEAVYIEGAAYDACIEDEDELTKYIGYFRRLTDAALDFDESRARMRRISKGFS